MTPAQEAAWIERHSVETRRALAELPDLSRIRLAYSGHLEPKLLPLFRGLRVRNCALHVTTCHPDTVRAETAAALSQLGAEVMARPGMSEEARSNATRAALDWQPTHAVEMGADLTMAAAVAGGSSLQAALECTGSGLLRLRTLPALPHPVFDGDNVPIKRELHNRKMVGVMTWHAFIERTHLSLHGKRVVVVGFGPVGEGLAEMGRAHGGEVVVVELDEGRRAAARATGFATQSLAEALPRADVVVTATGAIGVISAQHFSLLRDGCFLLNAGHDPREIDGAALLGHPHREVLPFVTEVELGERRVFFLAGGALFNLAASFGDSINAFDVILAALCRALGHVLSTDVSALPKRVHPLP